MEMFFKAFSKISFIFSEIIKVTFGGPWFYAPSLDFCTFPSAQHRLCPEVPQTLVQKDGVGIWHRELRKGFSFSVSALEK